MTFLTGVPLYLMTTSGTINTVWNHNTRLVFHWLNEPLASRLTCSCTGAEHRAPLTLPEQRNGPPEPPRWAPPWLWWRVCRSPGARSGSGVWWRTWWRRRRSRGLKTWWSARWQQETELTVRRSRYIYRNMLYTHPAPAFQNKRVSITEAYMLLFSNLKH